MQASPRHPLATRGVLISAYLTVCLVWGSTYLAILWGLESFPPFTMAGIRFILAGGALYGWRRLRGAECPKWSHWREAAIIGTLMLCGSNGLICWSEQYVPSGIVALMASTVPLFILVFDAIWFSRTPVTAKTGAGLVVSLVGVGWLTGVGTDSWHFDIRGMMAVAAAPVLWAIGTLRSRGARVVEDTIIGTAMQMISGGIALLLVALALQEPFQILDVSMRSLWALSYLIVFGSIIAYTAYTVLMRYGPAGPASTYALVNPVIAVLLGWTLGKEELGLRTIASGALILGGIALIRSTSPARRQSHRPQLQREEEAPGRTECAADGSVAALE